ncbi:MAG TPA: hypothetical protein VMF87_23720 [Streptosporangiaceae bacterium]|jgi:hypothetical protein|nr:hypothetical protein [Streptosporangiaceae bacterium]
MGLMDKVKAQATVLAQKTQDTARDIQAKRRADVMLRNLGAAVYADRTGRAGPNSQADIDKLIADLKTHEAENGGINLAPESAPSGTVPPQGGPADPGSPGGSGGPEDMPPGETTTQV